MPAETWVRRWWSGDAGAAGAVMDGLAWPLEAAFRAGVRLRNLSYDHGWLEAARPPIPVLSVGNLSVGGTGKTPMSAWLARRLADCGLRVALAVRGYAFDEILLHRRWNRDIPVLAARRRIRAVAAAAAAGAELAILDDGFQHRSIRRDADVVLVAAEAAARLRLLPRGPLREPRDALGRADLIVVTRRAASPEQAEHVAAELAMIAPGVPFAHVAFRPAGWQRLDGAPAAAPAAEVLAVAGIARPDLFAAGVWTAGDRAVELLAFPDHHSYTRADVATIRRRAGARTVVTTEKDAVKLLRFAERLGECRVLALAPSIEAGEADLDAILERLRRQAAAHPPNHVPAPPEP